jgi:integrase
VAVTPHMFRDIFATEYLNENPGDAAGVARRLGNTVATVYRHYAHLLNASADARADSWLRSKRG